MTTEPIALAAQADVLLALAAVLGEPDAARLARAAARLEDTELAARGGLGAAAPALGDLAAALRATPADAWPAERARLFSCGVPCPANETGYVRRDKGAVLGDVGAFHRAFGIALDESAGERSDHVVAELELVALLLVMLSRAEADERREDAAVTRAALRSFVEDHLGAWLPAFAARLAETTVLALGEAAAAALQATWREWTRAQGLPAARPLPLADEEPATPYECGMAEPDLARTHEGDL